MVQVFSLHIAVDMSNLDILKNPRLQMQLCVIRSCRRLGKMVVFIKCTGHDGGEGREMIRCRLDVVVD